MDRTGHSTLAQWTAADPASVDAAAVEFQHQLDQGYFATVSDASGGAEQVLVAQSRSSSHSQTSKRFETCQ